MDDRVASLWIGPRLGILEKLCLKSFADLGQTPILYTYEPLEEMPSYVEWRDASTILPLDGNGRIYRDPVYHSPAVHADLFRLHLMAKTDEIWVDCDAYAVKPFRTENGYLMAGRRDGQRRVHNGIIRLPKDSPALQNWMEFVRTVPCIPPWWERGMQRNYRKLYGKSVSFAALPLGVIGPLSAYYFLSGTGEIDNVLPEQDYYALPFNTRREWFAPDTGQLDQFEWQSKISIHFFSSVFRRILARRGGNIPRDSLIGKLIVQHGLENEADGQLQ